jgi:hypothetical protein
VLIARPMPRAPLCLLLAVALATNGCSNVLLASHHHAGSAVSVKVLWDDDGEARLVGGIQTTLRRLGPGLPDAVYTAPTRADVPLYFGDLEPGRYQLSLSGSGLGVVEERFDVRPGRRMSVRVLVDAFQAPDDGGGERAAEGALFVLKVVGAVLLVVVVVGVVLLLATLDDDDDCDDCERSCLGRERCPCTCHDERRR